MKFQGESKLWTTIPRHTDRLIVSRNVTLTLTPDETLDASNSLFWESGWKGWFLLMLLRDGPDSECASNFVQVSGKSATETLAMIRQAFGEESISHTWVFELHARKVRQVKSKVNSMIGITRTYYAVHEMFVQAEVQLLLEN
jgi:hypothetical protein